ncbi:hypothetical protein N9Z08_02445 [Pirellulales bacterium]|nr:hypothetical protein [Pirellulales bacterium]
MSNQAMYAFECSLHARPSNDSQEAETPLVDQWGQWPTLLVSQDQLSKPLPTEFDDAINKLNALPRLFAEPDGSFVWASPHENLRWQVNGNLYEKNDNILFVELKGCCPQVEFDQLLACFLDDENACVIQLTRAAVFVSARVFRAHACARGQAGDGESLLPPETCGW